MLQAHVYTLKLSILGDLEVAKWSMFVDSSVSKVQAPPTEANNNGKALHNTFHVEVNL